mgnify:CR=1 FL=1
MANKIIIIDFGGQYNQLIARRVREFGVYSEVHNFENVTVDKVKEFDPCGIIFTGGPQSAYGEGAPAIDKGVFELGLPILGICYGAQLMAHVLGGKIGTAPTSEYGRTDTVVDCKEGLFAGLSDETVTWMSHTDYISEVPEGFKITAHTENCPVAGMEDRERGYYAVQFHPEVNHTAEGTELLSNFILGVCRCEQDWKMDSFAEKEIAEIREKVGDGKVLLALSGGVDSSVVAALLAKAIGKQLTCVFVDHGLLRKDEGDQVEEIFGSKGEYDLNFVRVNAQERYYAKLAGVTDPETKRKIIGEEFIRVFEEEAKRIGAVDFLAQGTIYADIIESGLGKSAVIKSHHNVGGLPEDLQFTLIEPLRTMFKDEVRAVGLQLGLPDSLVWRHPFPGPGLGIRIIGEVTAERLAVLRRADAIARQELANARKEREIWQFPVVLLADVHSVGVQGDGRTYGHPIVLRPVTSDDAMTADWAKLPWELLEKISTRITNECSEVNRVVLDITSKPPATIEWE